MTELHKAIINDTGIGNIKDYTPKYRFIIPYFDIATWHDYMEENFRSIDALFNYIYEIKQYRGKWKQLTKVNVGEVYFIDDDEDPLNGRLVKVLVEHTTDDTAHFSDYYNAHQSYYEIFDDASAAQVYAKEAKGYRNEAETYKNSAQSYKNSAQSFATSAENSKNQTATFRDEALLAKNSAQTSATNAENYKNDAETAKDEAQTYSIKLEKLYDLCPFTQFNYSINKQSWQNNNDSQLSEQARSLYKYVRKTAYIFGHTIVDDEWLSNHCVSGLVTFSIDDILSSNYSPVVMFVMKKTETNQLQITFSIYAKEIPQNDIILESIIIYCREKQYAGSI